MRSQVRACSWHLLSMYFMHFCISGIRLCWRENSENKRTLVSAGNIIYFIRATLCSRIGVPGQYSMLHLKTAGLDSHNLTWIFLHICTDAVQNLSILTCLLFRYRQFRCTYLHHMFSGPPGTLHNKCAAVHRVWLSVAIPTSPADASTSIVCSIWY